MKTTNKKNLDGKIHIVREMDTLDFIRKSIDDSRAIINEITRERHLPAPRNISRKPGKHSSSIYQS